MLYTKEKYKNLNDAHADALSKKLIRLRKEQELNALMEIDYSVCSNAYEDDYKRYVDKYGTKYGGARPEAEVRHKAVKKLADEQARKVQDIIKTYRKAKASYSQIADIMNKLKIETARGGRWYGRTVQRYEQRL